ncbi:hypothetical protein [Actinophytocola xinjiangensis]|nr:hypothetical protein [Actinophytocola xinjiangensis]
MTLLGTACSAPSTELEESPVDLEESPADLSNDATGQPETDLSLAFGEAYQNQRGTVTVSAPEPYLPSDTAAMSPDSQRAIIVTVTASNTTSEVFSAYEWTVGVTADGQTGEEVVDYGTSGGPTDPPDILPGKTGSWRVALGLPAAEPAEIIVSVSMTWDTAESIYWEGTG